MGVVVRRYIHLLILPIPTPLASVHFCSSIPTFCSLKNIYIFSFLFQYFFVIKFYVLNIYIYILGELTNDRDPLTRKKRRKNYFDGKGQ